VRFCAFEIDELKSLRQFFRDGYFNARIRLVFLSMLAMARACSPVHTRPIR
jgi:hypothetical protein